MKENIFNQDNSQEIEIFKDESVFYPDYIPKEIFSRDKQIKEMIYELKKLPKNKRINHLLLYGPPGTGKTLLSGFVLDQLIEYSNKIKYKYINVIQQNTRFSVLSSIVELLGGILPRRGLAVDELIQTIKEMLKKSDILPIIILDEIDKMESIQASNLLYDLTRLNEDNKYFSLVLITNYKSFIMDLDLRTQSSLDLLDIEFNKYTPQDLKNILKERIRYGLIDNAISEDLIGYITGYAAKNSGDARVAIDLLYKSAKISERKGENKITRENVFEAKKLVDSIKLNYKLKYLTKPQKQILKNLNKTENLISKIYENNDYSKRAIRRYLTQLEKLDLIEIKKISEGKGGKRKVYLKFEKELLD